MNHLYYGDNLRVLRDHIRDESVDLIYLDPPFNSNASYNVLFRSPTGDQSAAHACRSASGSSGRASRRVASSFQYAPSCRIAASELR